MDVGARAQCAGVDPDEGQMAYEGVGHDLEHESGERFVVVGSTG
jgi:hypothetical protein